MEGKCKTLMGKNVDVFNSLIHEDEKIIVPKTNNLEFE